MKIELKRENSKKLLIFRILLIGHVLLLAHHCFTNIYGLILISGLCSHENDKVSELCRFGTFYATNWNFAFQTIFLSLSLLHDALEWLDKHESKIGQKIRYFRDVLFCGIVVPFTMFVCTMFWCVYNIDRELVFPQVYDQVIPWWFNHCVHTNIFIVVALETLLQSRRHPTNLKLEWICVITISVLYAIVYYSIYFYSHRWLYGVFGVMNWWQVCLYQCLIWASAAFFYVIQFPVNRLIHKKEVEEVHTPISLVLDHKSKSLDFSNVTDSNGVGKTNEVERKENGDEETGSKEVNGDSESKIDNSNGVNGDAGIDNTDKPFDRSWSAKYRSSRNEVDSKL